MKSTLHLPLFLGCCLGTAPAAVITSSNVVTSTQLSTPFPYGYSAASSTFAYTVPSGSGSCLVVFVNAYQTADFNVPTVSSITYGGAPMTRAVTHLQREHSNQYDNLSEIWYLANPVPGVSQNVVMSGYYMQSVANAAVTLAGVDPDDPIGQTGSTGSNADSGTLSLTLNNLELGSWVVSDLGHGYLSGSNSKGTNISGTFYFTTGSDQCGAAGYTVVDGTSETFSWNYSNGFGRASLVAAEFRAIPESGGTGIASDNRVGIGAPPAPPKLGVR